MKILTAKVTRAPKIVETKHGQRFVLDVELNGETQAIWGPPAMIPTVKWGEYITLGRDSKNKLHLVEGENVPVTATALHPGVNPSNQPQGIDPDTKRAIADYVTEQAKLFGFCLSQATTIQGIQPEDIRPVATTLYLSTQKRFGLN